MPAATSQIIPVRRMKQSYRHLWPLYGEFAAVLLVAGVFIASYKS